MAIDLNDPKLTAYILGELPDAEHAALEQDLAVDPTLRAETDALREMATRLQTELAAETVPAPTISVPRPSRNGKPSIRRFAIAVSLLTAAGVASYAAPRVGVRDGETTLANQSASQSATSPVWSSDDTQYFSTGPDMKIERDAKAQQQFLRSHVESSSEQSKPADSSPASALISAPLAARGKPGSHGNSVFDSPVGPSAPPDKKALDTIYGVENVQGGGSNSIGIATMGEGAGEAARTHTFGDPTAAPTSAIRRRGGDYGEGELTGQATRGSVVDRAQGQIDTLADSSGKSDHLATITGQTRRGDGEAAKESSRVPFGDSNLPLAPPSSPGTESYAPIAEQPFTAIRDKESALSTFSIDVDTASYSIVRSKLLEGHLPEANAVRVEEFINYFKYDYPQPDGDAPFSVNLEVAACPWQPEHRLVRVGLKGREIPRDKRPPSNLVFLLDVSGSMQPENKLPLVKQSMKLLVEQLSENDRVAIVTYAGEAGLKLSSTTAAEKEKINAAIDSLYAGGSTNGEGGLKLAYDVAVASKIAGGTNRVILATDGDFNVGLSSDADMEALITEKAATGVFLTAIGVGMGNLKDSKLERLADKGNGNYAYIDKPSEAHKVFVEQLAGTLVTIAKDVKIQVEFNPATVRAHRLVGYENRLLAHKDFNDDRKDAGEIGAGHSVTALYEIVPATTGARVAAGEVDKSRYQAEPPAPAVPLADAAKSGELMVVKLRYKQPEGTESKLIETTVKTSDKRFYEASADFKFAAAVATFAMRLRDSQHRGGATFALALELAQSALARDESGRRREFVDLVTRAKHLAGER